MLLVLAARVAVRVGVVSASASASHPLAIGEERLVARVALEQRQDHVARRPAPLDDLQELPERHQLLEPLLELVAGDLGAVGQHDDARFERRA